jgi:hypothetical protein
MVLSHISFSSAEYMLASRLSFVPSGLTRVMNIRRSYFGVDFLRDDEDDRRLDFLRRRGDLRRGDLRRGDLRRGDLRRLLRLGLVRVCLMFIIINITLKRAVL